MYFSKCGTMPLNLIVRGEHDKCSLSREANFMPSFRGSESGLEENKAI